MEVRLAHCSDEAMTQMVRAKNDSMTFLENGAITEKTVLVHVSTIVICTSRQPEN